MIVCRGWRVRIWGLARPGKFMELVRYPTGCSPSMATTFGKQLVLSGLHSFDLLAGSLLTLERCTFAFRDKNGWQQIAEDAGVMAIEVEVSSPLDNNIYPHQKLCRPKMPSNLAKCTQYNPNQVPQETFPITSHYFQTSFTNPYLSPS